MEPKKHGAFYWFLHNTRVGVTGFYRRHKIGASIGLLVVAALSFMLRAVFHPFVLEARKKSFLLILVALILGLWIWARRKRRAVKVLASVLATVGIIALFIWGGALHDYVALYYRYKTLNVVELDKLPITGHERLQPLNSIYSLAHEAMTEMEAPQRPDFVRSEGDYRWTMAIEPAHILPRLLHGQVKEVVSVHADMPLPNFSKRDQVHFEVGEGMLLGRNTLTATVKTFGIWKYLHYEPVDVKYVRDDSGEWVQVVSLVRWKGIFFPRPEFGGVQVVRQGGSGFGNSLKRMLFGAGEWISPEDVPRHQFLVGQNNLAYEVSRYIANSFRFQNGFFGPMPGNHRGDVRIPDMPGDLNDQPFTTYFEEVADRPGMLYHYFALEPFDPDKQGLNVSLFIPADGTGPSYVYKHFEKSGTVTGFSAIAAKIMDTRKEYDWTRHRPVEHRPFIRDINGERRLFALTTIVTLKDEHGAEGEELEDGEEKQRWFIAGADPNIVITDAALNIPVWVSFDPDRWVDELRAELERRGVKPPK